MRALVCAAWGGPETLRLGELPDPVPGPGEVVLRARAAGVNFADTLLIQGKYQEKPAVPFAPGLEVAGEVAALGPGVTHLRIGQRALAPVDHGAFAQLVKARASDAFAIPDAMDWATAAGFPITYGTAHGALVWRAGLKAGETLVVHGAAGGVGLATVEVGKALGARVIGTAGGADKIAVALEHGADAVIDYKSEDLRARLRELTGGRGADVYFDPVGGEVFEASLRAIAWEGRIVVIGFAGGAVPQIPANILLVKNVSAVGFYWGSYRRQAPDRLAAQFADLFRWFEQGRLKPHVSHRLPLGRAAEAFELLQQRKATGKVVVEI
jgi:NADPH2:quinone reductase